VDLGSRTAQLCIAGTQAEFERRIDDARTLFREAWEAAADDHDACIAAHYVAHLEPDPHAALRWNMVALEHGRLDERANEFMGSLLVSVGGAHESLGDHAEAERYFAMASELGVEHFRG
jgi:hypothetical protein